MAMYDTNAALVAITAALNGRDPNAQAMITDFVQYFEPDRLRQDGVARLRAVLSYIANSFAPEFALELYLAAYKRYPPDCLTPVHGFFARQCCLARRYDYGVWLDARSIDRMPRDFHLNAEDHMAYHYFAAICHFCRGNYDRALSLLTLVLQAGGEASSKIQVEAYQKYILIGLMRDGRAAPPADMSQALSRSLQHIANAYDELADACHKTVRATFNVGTQTATVAAAPATVDQTGSDGDESMQDISVSTTNRHTDTSTTTTTTSPIDRVLTKHRNAFQNDNNMHIIDNIRQLLPMHRAREVSRVYASISLVDFADRCGLASAAEAESLLGQCIPTGLLNASVTNDGFVTFHDTRHDVSSTSAKPVNLAELETLQQRMIKMQRMLEYDRTLRGPAADQTSGGGGGGGLGRVGLDGGRFSQPGTISPTR